MSVLIKDMEKPKYCCVIINGKAELCPFVNTEDDCVLLLAKGICEGTWKEQYSKCPLVETPEPCEDAVSRKAVYEAMIEKGQRSCRYRLGETWELNGVEIREALDTVPSVTPKRKKWKWIECEDNTSFVKQLPRRWIECPECGASYDPGYKSRYLFCPNCGADMRGEQDG